MPGNRVKARLAPLRWPPLPQDISSPRGRGAKKHCRRVGVLHRIGEIPRYCFHPIFQLSEALNVSTLNSTNTTVQHILL